MSLRIPGKKIFKPSKGPPKRPSLGTVSTSTPTQATAASSSSRPTSIPSPFLEHSNNDSSVLQSSLSSSVVEETQIVEPAFKVPSVPEPHKSSQTLQKSQSQPQPLPLLDSRSQNDITSPSQDEADPSPQSQPSAPPFNLPATVATTEPTPISTPLGSSPRQIPSFGGPPRVARAASVTSSRASTGKSLLVAAANKSLLSAAKNQPSQHVTQSLSTTEQSPRRKSDTLPATETTTSLCASQNQPSVSQNTATPPTVLAPSLSSSSPAVSAFGLPPMVSSSMSFPPAVASSSASDSFLPPPVGASPPSSSIEIDPDLEGEDRANLVDPQAFAEVVIASGETSETDVDLQNAGEEYEQAAAPARRKRGRPKTAVRVAVPRNKRLKGTKHLQDSNSFTTGTETGISEAPPLEVEEEANGLVNPLASPLRRRIGRRVRESATPRHSKAGTTQDERIRMQQRKERGSTNQYPELEGVEPEDMVGTDINPHTMQMKDLATTRMAEGRVSARAIKLHEFHRAQEEEKRRARAERVEHLWKQRQLIRRRARRERNARRERKRKESVLGTFHGEISEDSEDSEEDFEPIPDRLTPPGSPEPEQRIAPMRIEPLPLTGEDEEEYERGEEEGKGVEGEEYRNRGYEELREGYQGNAYWQGEGGEDEDRDEGHRLDGFQLQIEEGEGGEDQGGEDYQPEDVDYSNLQEDEYYTGGHFDDDGNWVEGQANLGLLRYRNEERIRDIMENNQDRVVEVVDSEVQFVNSATFAKKVSTDRWTKAETEVFFEVLRETGENYTLMKAYFPGRTAKQLKRKGIRENRDNPERMNEAIFNRKPMDKTYLAKSSGFDTEAPYDKERSFLREVAEEKERIKRLDTEAAEAEVAGAAAASAAAVAAKGRGEGEGEGEADYVEGDAGYSEGEAEYAEGEEGQYEIGDEGQDYGGVYQIGVDEKDDDEGGQQDDHNNG